MWLWLGLKFDICAPLSLGKSLDKIAELREKNKLSKPGKKKRKNAQAKLKNIKLSNEVKGSNAPKHHWHAILLYRQATS